MNLGLLLLDTTFFALGLGIKVIIIGVAAAVEEWLAHALFGIKVVTGHFRLAAVALLDRQTTSLRVDAAGAFTGSQCKEPIAIAVAPVPYMW